jgi:hypothetical protein
LTCAAIAVGFFTAAAIVFCAAVAGSLLYRCHQALPLPSIAAAVSDLVNFFDWIGCRLGCFLIQAWLVGSV